MIWWLLAYLSLPITISVHGGHLAFQQNQNDSFLLGNMRSSAKSRDKRWQIEELVAKNLGTSLDVNSQKIKGVERLQNVTLRSQNPSQDSPQATLIVSQEPMETDEVGWKSWVAKNSANA